MKVIWALFDDGGGSWNKLNKDNVISVGINDNKWTNYYKIDLSIQNSKLIKQLEKLPKPDIIVASPPCESWSIADNQQRLWRKQQGRNIEVFTKQDIEYNNSIYSINLKRDYYKQWRTTLNGMSTILGLLSVIDHFKPPIWIIENPRTSKIWEFIKENVGLEGYHNVAHYNCYDKEFSQKPTIFFSNVKLNLMSHKIPSGKRWESVHGYKKRSMIPSELLEDILKQVENL